MDFPEILETCEFTDGAAEIKQSVKLLLQNVVGSFCQDSSLGALFDVHIYDYAYMHAAVLQTLSVLPISVSSVDVSPPLDSDVDPTCRINVVYTYNHTVFTFKNF